MPPGIPLAVLVAFPRDIPLTTRLAPLAVAAADLREHLIRSGLFQLSCDPGGGPVFIAREFRSSMELSQQRPAAINVGFGEHCKQPIHGCAPIWLPQSHRLVQCG